MGGGSFGVCNTLPSKSIRVTSISLLRALISVDQMEEFISLSKQLLWNRFLPNHRWHQRQVSLGDKKHNRLICIDER